MEEQGKKRDTSSPATVIGHGFWNLFSFFFFFLVGDECIYLVYHWHRLKHSFEIIGDDWIIEGLANCEMETKIIRFLNSGLFTDYVYLLPWLLRFVWGVDGRTAFLASVCSIDIFWINNFVWLYVVIMFNLDSVFMNYFLAVVWCTINCFFFFFFK